MMTYPSDVIVCGIIKMMIMINFAELKMSFDEVGRYIKQQEKDKGQYDFGFADIHRKD